MLLVFLRTASRRNVFFIYYRKSANDFSPFLRFERQVASRVLPCVLSVCLCLVAKVGGPRLGVTFLQNNTMAGGFLQKFFRFGVDFGRSFVADS